MATRIGLACVLISATSIALLTTACRHDEPTPAAVDGITGHGAEVLARVGDQDVLRRDAERAYNDRLRDYERKQRELVEKGLEEAIEESLLALEARNQGLDLEALVAQEVEAKVVEPTEADVESYYQANRDRMPPEMEQIASRIADYLRQIRLAEARRIYLAQLRKSHPVDRLLQPHRVDARAGDAPSRGPLDAPVTIVEFSDFECAFCRKAAPTLERIWRDYPDQVRLAYRHFPLQNHPHARKAAEASMCAAEQDRFWQLHDALFEDASLLPVAQLKLAATDLGLDAAAFSDCLDSGRYEKAVNEDWTEGKRIGVTGTPALFVNGRLVAGAVPYEQMAAVIDDELERLGVPVPEKAEFSGEGR